MFNSLSDMKEMAIAIAENSVQGIVVMDEQGMCLYANRAWLEITGFSAADMHSKPVHDWVHHHRPNGQPLPIHECPIGCTLGNNECVRNHRDLFFRKDGTSFHVSCAASPIMVDDATVLKILEIRDVTREVETEQRRDEFLAMLAHELRNPLAPISAAASLLEIQKLDEQSVRRSSRIIARQVSHMTGLIDDLLDASRVTQGHVRLEKTACDLASVILDAAEQIRPLIDGKRHRFTVDVAQQAATVWGDRKRLVQICANVIGNAAKYTAEGGEILVSLTMLEKHVQVTVSDNGIGMTAEMIGRAFELFTQAKRSPDRSQGGLGIGLALVRSLVLLHGGTVWIQSAGIGHGAKVTMELPRATQSAVTTSEVADVLDTAHSLNILIVEDTKDTGDALGMVLGVLGHDVRVERDPYAAMQTAGNKRFDVFLIDIGLPGMDGMEMARRIRRQPQHADAMLIAITGYGQARDRLEALEAGFDHHMVKPANLHDLQNLLSGRTGRVATVDDEDQAARTTAPYEIPSTLL
ncbi:ATP-binding protein [Pseudoduganella umbonata]|nr:ATP-binding protein [Pseudoduganella umbonata]MBB3224890.1 PAS domain S-box-containing protein [Pseudoduganella umbonata]